MTSPANSPAEPTYAESELYDSPDDLARWPLLAPLLKTWQTEVWEKDHTEFRGCWHYDQEAIRLQNRHRLAVILAAITGTGAVVLAILQLGKIEADVLMYLEMACLVAAVVTIVLGIFLSLDHRWRELRFKAEQYRMLKFRFLHDAAGWLAAGEEERDRHLFTHLLKIHGANREAIKEWIRWKIEMLPLLEAPDVEPDLPLALELADYFRQRRLLPQRHYFHKRGHRLHSVERIVRWVGPGLFFASVFCALAHAAIHVAHRNSEGGTEQHDSASLVLFAALALALLAAILPVAAAGVRTWRGAFEFGRNALRFESMAHHLEHLLSELDKAKTPEAILAILRRGEYAMESEHRAWMRLMMEAEWFG